MNERTAGAVLLVIGVVALFAAIVGGGIKIQQIEVGSVQSKWRQWLLAAFGLVIGVIGLALVIPDEAPTNAANTENVASGDDNAVDANQVDANATTDSNAVEENTESNGTDENAGDNSAEGETNQTE
jgi:hypothetical protein